MQCGMKIIGIDRIDLPHRARYYSGMVDVVRADYAVEVSGSVLSGMLRKGGEEKVAAIAVVRATLATTRAVPAAAKKLNMTERLLQQWVKKHPSMSAGLVLAKAGRPARKPVAKPSAKTKVKK